MPLRVRPCEKSAGCPYPKGAGLLLMSVGMGLTFVPVTLIATTNVSAEDAGLASGLFNTSQQIGGALGLASCCSARSCGAATSPT